MAYKRTSPGPIVEGYTNASTMATTNGTIYYDGTRLVTTATGSSGFVLTSNGAAAPTYQAIPAASITINGDTGSASGSSINLHAQTQAGGTIFFNASASTVTLDVTDVRFNVFLGLNAGNTTNTANQSAAFGFGCLPAVTSGNYNCAIGNNCLNALQTGDGNVAVGTDPLFSLNGGSHNFGMGFLTLFQLINGSSNICIGHQTGFNYTGAESYNIIIGESVVGTVGESGVTRIGTPGQQTSAFISGINGVNVGSVSSVVSISGDHLGSTTITAGTGISVTAGANTITIASTATGFAWSVITVNQTAAVSNGYFCNKAGTLALALPAASAVGDTIEVANENTATGIQFTQAAGQQILIGNTNTTLGATGTLTSSAVGDTLKIVCKVANTIWRVTSVVGNWTPA